jgi:hypothetical protein
MRGKPVTFSDFRGGVNKRDAPYLLADTEARDARNVQSGVRGAIRKRDGAIGFAEPAVPLTSLFAAQDPTFLIGADGVDTIYRIDPAGTVIALSVTALNVGLWEWVQAPANGGQGPVWGMSGSRAVSFDGGTGLLGWTASAGTLPIGRYLEYAGGRVWVAHIESGPTLDDPGSYVAWSDIGNPRSWPAANLTGFDPNDGETITGIGRVGPYILVFKPSKCWVIYDTDTSANRPLAENTGAVAHRSIVETDQGTFFLSRDQGVYVTNGSGVDRLPDTLQPVFEAIAHANRHLAAAAVFDGHYYLSISESGNANTILLDYDLALESWWLHTLPAAQLAVWEPAGEPRLYGAVPGVTRVDRLFVPGRVVDAEQVERTNLCTNPKAGAGATTGWVTGGTPTTFAAVTLGSGGAPLPSAELDALGVGTAFRVVGDGNDDRIRFDHPVVSGRAYRWSVYLYVDSLSATSVQALAVSGVTFKAGASTAVVDGWVRLDFGFTADETATWALWIRQVGAGASDFYATAVLIEEAAALGPYFDGDSADGRWTGTPEASTSELLETQVYAAYWTGPHHTFRAPQRRKRARALQFDGKGQIEVSVARDFAVAPVLEGTADFSGEEGAFGVDPVDAIFGETFDGVYGGIAQVGEQILPSLGVARAFSVQFGNNIAESFEVDSYTFALQDRRD